MIHLNIYLEGQPCNWDLGIGNLICACIGLCDCQFAGQWTVTDRYGSQLGSLSKAWVVTYVNAACTRDLRHLTSAAD